MLALEDWNKTMPEFLIYLFIGCSSLILALEPNEPKKDGRFRTGYKNNAKKPKKSANTIKLQRILGVVALISVVIFLLIPK